MIKKILIGSLSIATLFLLAFNAYACGEPTQCNANATQIIVSDSVTKVDGHASVPVGTPYNVRWTASIPGATWIWSEDPIANPVVETTKTFTRNFYIIGTPLDATLNIAADNSYTVSVNGHSVGADATEFNYQSTGQDYYTIPAADLLSGTNTINFTVTNWAMVNGTTATNPAGLLYKLTVNNNECKNPNYENCGKWNVKGTYVIDFKLGGVDYLHTMDITSMNLATGDFSGTGFYNADHSYTWTVTGNVNGSNITYHIIYTGSNDGYTIDATGTITTDGNLSGTAKSPGQIFTWENTSGQATKLSCGNEQNNCGKWNVAGNWIINVEYSGTNYPENLVLAQTGTGITGTSLNTIPPANGSAFTVIGGSVTGNAINFDAKQDAGSVVVHFSGTIAVDGSMSGSWADTAGGLNRTGTWASTNGKAIKSPCEIHWQFIKDNKDNKKDFVFSRFDMSGQSTWHKNDGHGKGK